ncbi:MAG TPA: hypothetical protein VHZ54_02345 [Solirubrobacterales bacterium]|nr:hypothetical protein [Solirubrobacterales bacterium]
MTRSARQARRRHPVPGRKWTATFGLLLLTAAICVLAAAGSSGASTGGSTVRITADGRIGTLRMDRSDKFAIIAFAGEPEVDELDSGVYPGSGWEALGYRCGPKDTLAPLVATAAAQGPYCRTVYYLNSETGRLGTFFTSMPTFRDNHGVFVGMRTAKADRLEGKKAVEGCLEGIAISSPSATFHVIITGGHARRRGNELVVRGGRVGALVLHGRSDDVGVFDCW